MARKKLPIFIIYKAKDGWRWKLKAANSKIIAESGEAYAKKPNWETLIAKLELALGGCTVQVP